MFEEKYLLLETIGQQPNSNPAISQEITSIVKDKRNKYFIAKKVRVDDQKTKHEIGLMRSLSHPNIIRLHQIIPEGSWTYIIEEYCEEGDLEYYLRRQSKMKKKIPEEVVSRWMLQALLALEYLHHSKIIHRDIRPKNIFLTSHGNIKIGSFRASKQLQADINYAQTLINSAYYMTPELLQGNKYDSKVDIWALGCVLYEICWLKPLTRTPNLIELIHKNSPESNKQVNIKGQQLPTFYSKQLNMVLQKTMKKSPQDRVSAQQLLKTNYFLNALEKFISDEGLNIALLEKIPIKKYKIHRSKYEHIKLKRGLVKAPSLEKKENLLPRIEVVQPNSIDRKIFRGKSKERIVAVTHTPVIKSKGIIRDMPSRVASTEKKKIKTECEKSREKSDDGYRRESALQRKERKQAKYMLAPPLLPKPFKKTDRSTTERQVEKRAQKCVSEQDLNQNFEATMSKQSLSRQLANFQKKDLKQINQNLNKMFQNWNMSEEDEIQFEFEQESQLRLTSKASKQQSANLLKTFKTKLQQLIQQINYKYCPDMEPIAEKTTEFDSNSLSTFQRIRLQ